jgi:hypothetical protein
MYVLVVCSWVVLGEIIRSIVYSFLPKDVELALWYVVVDPIKVHINCFGSLLFDAVICNTSCCAVIGLNWSWRLLMAQFL